MRQRPGQPKVGLCDIWNNSHRPIREVTCRMLVNGRLLMPTEFRIGEPMQMPGPDRYTYLPAPTGVADLGTGRYLNLLAGRHIRLGFNLDDAIDIAAPAVYLIRFLDDAEQRWQLDVNQRLQPPLDSGW